MLPSESEAALGAEPDFPTAPSCPITGISQGFISVCPGVRSTWVCILVVPLAAGFVILGKFQP